jgi:hypothetical protein
MRRTAPRIVSDVAMLARLTRDLPGFLRSPVTAEQAATSVKRRLETRSERFLETVARTIYGHAPSPYLRLLRAADCELGDLQDLVRREGIEGALAHIADQGIYVSFDEFKGRRQIVRGSERFAVAESDFDNPRYRRMSSCEPGHRGAQAPPSRSGCPRSPTRRSAPLLPWTRTAWPSQTRSFG